MHEQSLFNGLLRRIEAVATEHGACRVVGVRVRLGALASISPDHFREHFEVSAAGTVAEGARIEIVRSEDLNDPEALHMVIESVDVAEES